jgi:transposase InsO family protein
LKVSSSSQTISTLGSPRACPEQESNRAETHDSYTTRQSTIHLSGAGLESGDGRPHADRKTPAHALSAEERERILQIANEPRFAELPPARIVPMLADEGVYIASESSFSRVLRAHGQVRHRGRAKEPQRSRPPSTHVATAPRQLWCWDLTYLASRVIGKWFYLYVILDAYSRKIVGFEVHDTDSSDHAAELLKRTALAEGIHALESKPVCHGDNGATMKATTVLAMMHWLGLTPSYSRPRVSDDNAYVESLFRTAKYRPQYPSSGFNDLEAARRWASDFRLVQHRAPSQRNPLHQPRRAPCRTRPRDPGTPPCAVPRGPGKESQALVPTHAQLAAGRIRHAQSRARLRRESRTKRRNSNNSRCVRRAATILSAPGDRQRVGGGSPL